MRNQQATAFVVNLVNSANIGHAACAIRNTRNTQRGWVFLDSMQQRVVDLNENSAILERMEIYAVLEDKQ